MFSSKVNTIITQPTALLIIPVVVFLCLSSRSLVQAEYLESFVDNSGKTHTITSPFKRIISLYSAHTENICSLDGEDLLVGISRTDDFPQAILTRPKFSYREDPEKFINLQPDLVLVRPMIERSYPEFIRKLENAGITVVSLQPNSVDEMFEYWRALGKLTDRNEQAETMITLFQTRLAEVQKYLEEVDQRERPKVYFQSIHTKMKTFAPTSIGVFVLEQAGGVNIAADAKQVRKTNIAFYGKEQLLSHGSEIDIFLAQRGRMNPITTETIYQEPGFMAIKAVRQKRIHLIEEALVSRPTLRILDGIDQLYDLFYPEQQANILEK